VDSLEFPRNPELFIRADKLGFENYPPWLDNVGVKCCFCGYGSKNLGQFWCWIDGRVFHWESDTGIVITQPWMKCNPSCRNLFDLAVVWQRE